MLTCFKVLTMNTFKAEVNKIFLALASVGIVILLMFPVSLSATHFRYGTMSWEPVSDNGTHKTIRLKMELGWKRDYNAITFHTVGDVPTFAINVYWGDGSTFSGNAFETFKIKVLSSDSGSNSAIVEMGTGTNGTNQTDWTAGATHPYPDNGTSYVITWSGGDRIDDIENMANDSKWRSQQK